MESIPAPLGAPPLSVAETLRANFEKARQEKPQEVEHPKISGLFIVFRDMTDFNEFADTANSVNGALAGGQQEIDYACRMLVKSSVDSYAIVNGIRHDIGLPLGLALYDMIFPPQEGEPIIRPATDEQAVSVMFGDDTLSLVMFSRRLKALRKITASLVEAEPGKS